jgi:hypothetical protein
MFRSATIRFAARMSDLIDEMLVGDFDYIFDDGRVYADVDYHRAHPHHTAALTWTPAAGRGAGPQRPAVAGPKARRPGTVPTQPAACVAPVRAACSRPATVAGRTRTSH